MQREFSLEKAICSQSLEDRIAMDALIHDGLSVVDVETLEDKGFLSLKSMIDNNVLPRKTWENAAKNRDRKLTATNSERILRVARINARAEEVFGNRDKAALWLERPTSALNGKAPVAMLATESGARAVELLLDRINYGFAA